MEHLLRSEQKENVIKYTLKLKDKSNWEEYYFNWQVVQAKVTTEQLVCSEDGSDCDPQERKSYSESSTKYDVNLRL